MSETFREKDLWESACACVHMREYKCAHIYLTDVKSTGFRFQFEASHVTSHTEELGSNETVRRWMTIYIYIYKRVCVCVCVCGRTCGVVCNVCVRVYVCLC